MEKLNAGTAKKLLQLVHHFILREILPDDPTARQQVTDIFNELHNLLQDYEERQGG